jgi:murein DD-endopeptidase MepM/ murein hydrolase activator NlpD
VKLPGAPHEQFAAGVPLDASQLRPGDLVAFGPEGSDHVGFYVGDGVMIHVAESAAPVQLDGYDPADLALFSRPGQPSVLVGFAGFLRRPVAGPVTSGFGARVHPIYGDVRVHKGLDLSARSGEAVHAAAGGVVVEAGWQGGYGNAVLIDHGNGLATFYAHNSRNEVEIGQRVRAGDVIALAGSTGASTGPHVHFEVRVNGQAVDPAPYLGVVV